MYVCSRVAWESSEICQNTRRRTHTPTRWEVVGLGGCLTICIDLGVDHDEYLFKPLSSYGTYRCFNETRGIVIAEVEKYFCYNIFQVCIQAPIQVPFRWCTWTTVWLILFGFSIEAREAVFFAVSFKPTHTASSSSLDILTTSRVGNGSFLLFIVNVYKVGA